jgi:hypothetical protein
MMISFLSLLPVLPTLAQHPGSRKSCARFFREETAAQGHQDPLHVKCDGGAGAQ